jgi:Zn-dependent membrane protease YugP
MLLSLYAQHKVRSTFNKYTQVAARSGMTGAQVAHELLAASGVRDVQVEAVAGQLTDHYDPRDKTVRLSEAVYHETSLAALGVAAHEVGHAIQHNEDYLPLAMRSGLFPVVNIGSRAATPIIMIGFFLAYSGGDFGSILLNIGIILFSFTVLFQIITLPVEFNASSRALELLERQRVLSSEEAVPTKRVLDAAALTYVAAAIASALTLIRFLLLSRRR